MVPGAGKTAELAVCTPVIETNGEAKIVPHIIQEKMRSTKNKINLHQPPIIAAGTSPTVIHMRHVHMAIENTKPLFQNELNQGVSLFIFSHTARTNEFHMVTFFSLANASIEITADQRNLSISNGIAQKKTQNYIHMVNFITYSTKLESSKTKQIVSDQHGMTTSKDVHSKHGIPNVTEKGARKKKKIVTFCEQSVWHTNSNATTATSTWKKQSVPPRCFKNFLTFTSPSLIVLIIAMCHASPMRIRQGPLVPPDDPYEPWRGSMYWHPRACVSTRPPLRT